MWLMQDVYPITDCKTNNPEISPETPAMLESIEYFRVLREVRSFPGSTQQEKKLLKSGNEH